MTLFLKIVKYLNIIEVTLDILNYRCANLHKHTPFSVEYLKCREKLYSLLSPNQTLTMRLVLKTKCIETLMIFILFKTPF